MDKIDRYEIKSELGRGGMATVYHAYDPRFQRDVAIKVLPREFLHDTTFKARFTREAQAVAGLEHPGIVPVYDVGEEDGQPFLVMRLLSNGPLTDRLEKGVMPPQEVARILSYIAPALDEAHRRGIIHRDLKPDNILFDNQEVPFITDFGIAKLSEGSGTLTTANSIIGTPAYMSPEQANGDPVDGRSDIYALGVILFQMLTGRLPYEAKTPIGLIMKHLTEEVPRSTQINSRLPADCDMVVARALAKDPDDRFATALDMSEALMASIQQTKKEPSRRASSSLFAVPKRIKPSKKLVDTAQRESTQVITCPNCQTKNGATDTFCSNCHKRLKVECIVCHTPNRVDATHCINCGTNFKRAKAQREALLNARQRSMAEREEAALRRKQARQLISTVHHLMEDLGSRRRREEALENLNLMDEQDFEVMTEILVKDRDWEARLAAAEVIAQLAGRSEVDDMVHEQALNTLAKAADDPNEKVRQFVHQVLERFKRRREISDMFKNVVDWFKGE